MTDEQSPHEHCIAHSGLSGRVNLLIALMSFVTVLLGITLKTTIDIKGDILVEVAKMDGRVKALEVCGDTHRKECL